MLLLHILKKGIREFVVGLPPFLASASSNLVAFATAQFRLGPRHFVGSVTRSFLSWVLQCVTGASNFRNRSILWDGPLEIPVRSGADLVTEGFLLRTELTQTHSSQA